MSHATEYDSIGPLGLTTGSTEATLAGQMIADRYDVLELVGVGGMGAVYRARDRELDEVVALKVIRRELAGLPAMAERFRHEVKLARRVTHVNVARTFELGAADGLMYCTMELIEGESLARRLAQRGKLGVGEAVAIAYAMCDGLAAAHAASVIHRDIKPDNVLIAEDGRVVLADFGVAAVGVGASGELSGTPAYMAPEQARGEPATPASDVYAVGMVLYELLTGIRAFAGEAVAVLEDKQRVVRVVPTEVPAELAAVIGQATARDPHERTATAAALRRALTPWASKARAPTQPFRSPLECSELTTIVVLAPYGMSPEDKLYLAEAVHEELLVRLARLPRVRVLPRVSGTVDPRVYGVSLEVRGERVRVEVTHPEGPETVLDLALASDRVAAAADTIAASIGSAIRCDSPMPSEAYELLLSARHDTHREIGRLADAVRKLQRALEVAPGDPRVTASLAAAQVRVAFFVPDRAVDALASAVRHARVAVASAPDLADAQLAAGHVELMTGNPVEAARHFRAAIKCAPHMAEAHEQLGRMLLEAGYMSAAIARLEEALAIMPGLRNARWEIARAFALDQRWDEHEKLVGEILADDGDRPLARARYGWWRGDLDALAKIRVTAMPSDRTPWSGLMESALAVYLDGEWAARKAAIIAAAQDENASRRRTTFIAQLSAETAAFAGDHETAIALIARAVDHGLFDLHWMDRCTLLEPIRTHPGFAPLRNQVKQRAEAILDALYGDHAAVSETQIA